MISFKQIFQSILFIVGIMPSANALMVPFINKDGESLAFNKKDEFIVDPASTKQISLQLTHLDPPWETTKEDNYNCVRLICGKGTPTDLQQKLISQIISLFIYLGTTQNPTLSFFSNQLHVMNLVNTKALSQKTPNIIPLLDQNGHKVFLGKQDKPIFLKFFHEANQECCNKVVLMCGETPATAEEQKLITERANIIKKTIYKQSETDRIILITFGNFYTQLMIMNSPTDTFSFSLLTNQDATKNFEYIFKPMVVSEKPKYMPARKCEQIEQKDSIIFEEENREIPVAKNNHETLTLTHIEKPDNLKIDNYILNTVNPDYGLDNMTYEQQKYERIRKEKIAFQKVRDTLSTYELSLYKIGDIIFKNDFIINETQIHVQQIKVPTQPPAWAQNKYVQQFKIPTQLPARAQSQPARMQSQDRDTIKINITHKNLIEQLNKLKSAANIKQRFNKGQALSFFIGLKYDIWLEFKVEKGQDNSIIVSTSNSDDNINVTQNPVIVNICKFLLDEPQTEVL